MILGKGEGCCLDFFYNFHQQLLLAAGLERPLYQHLKGENDHVAVLVAGIIF
jgi:hypothetical protein